MRPLTFLICLASIVFLAGLSARSVDTTVPGATVCEPLTEVGQYWVRATATDTDVNQSGLSTEIVKTLPGDVCWENPSQNIDNSPLTDLAFVTLLYSTSPIVAGGTGPNSVTIRPNSVSCPGCDNLAANLLVGETGKEVAVAWDALPGADEIRIQVVGYGGTVPIISGVLPGAATGWNFTPSRAGLYFSRIQSCAASVCSAWINSYDQSFMYFFKLAAPAPGGID